MHPVKMFINNRNGLHITPYKLYQSLISDLSLVLSLLVKYLPPGQPIGVARNKLISINRIRSSVRKPDRFINYRWRTPSNWLTGLPGRKRKSLLKGACITTSEVFRPIIMRSVRWMSCLNKTVTMKRITYLSCFFYFTMVACNQKP